MVNIEKISGAELFVFEQFVRAFAIAQKVRLFEQKYRKSFEDFETEFTESYSRFNKLDICNSAGKKVALAT